MGILSWVKTLVSADRQGPAPVPTAADPPSLTTLSEAQTQDSTHASARTIGEMQTQGMPGSLANDGLIKGWQFSATMQLRTPLRVLLWHNKIILDKQNPPPIVTEEPWEGVWIPQVKTWRELGVPVDEFQSTMASEVGYIPEDGGNFLPFLIAVREIVEAPERLQVRLDKLLALLADRKWREDALERIPDERIVDSFFPLFVDTIPGCDSAIACELRKLTFDTPARLAAASDEALLAVKGIGPARLRKFREHCEHVTENRDLDRIDAVMR